VNAKRTFCSEEKTVKLRDQATNAQYMPTEIRSDVPEGTSGSGPSLAEIRQRALEIHVEHGGDGSDLENYLDEWLQAERELQEKCNKSSGE
jgi:hypothetical protein